MNVRFEPAQLIDINTIRYCDFCAQAVVSDTVHNSQNCVLDDLNLVDTCNNHIKTLNFGFYQCFLKNCTAQEEEEKGFTEHLTSHGIWLDRAKSKYKYKCGYCSYKTTQQRYLDNHVATCRRNQTKNEVPTSSASQQVSSKRAQESEGKRSTKKRAKISDNENPENKRSSHRIRCNECEYSTTQQHYLLSHQKHQCPKRVKLSNVVIKQEKTDPPCSQTSPIKLKLKLKRSSAEYPNREKGANKNVKIEIPEIGNKTSVSPETSNNVQEDESATAPQKSKAKIHKCVNCNFKTSNALLINLHMNTCNGRRGDVTIKKRKAQVLLTKVTLNVKTQSGGVCYDQCSYDGPTPLRLKMHKSRQHSESSDKIDQVINKETSTKVKCPNCPFTTKHYMDKHLQYCRGNTTQRMVKRYRCKRCFYVTPFSYNMLRHQTLKNSCQKPVAISYSTCKDNQTFPKLKCSFCPFKGKLSIMVKHHEERCVSKLYKNLRCPSCSDVLKTKKKLQNHIKKCVMVQNFEQKTSTRLHECQKCLLEQCVNGKATRTTLHCSKCGFLAKTKTLLAMHSSLCGIPKHESGRCQRCNHIGSSLDSYLRHKKACRKVIDRSNTVVVCDKCKSKVLHKAYHRSHKFRCGRPEYSFKCPHKCCVVGILAKDKQAIKIHIAKMHSLEKLKKMPRKKLKKAPSKNIKKAPLKNLKKVHLVKKVALRNRCIICSYVSPSKVGSSRHIVLCRQKQEGSDKVVTCQEPGCLFLARSYDGRSMKNHIRFKHPNILETKSTEKNVRQQFSQTNSMHKELQKEVKAHLWKCPDCGYECVRSCRPSRHAALCAMKRSGVSDIITCDYPECLFLTDSKYGYISHFGKMHKVINKHNHCKFKGKRRGKNRIPTCKYCQYSVPVSELRKMVIHNKLCSRKRKGDKSIVMCSFPGCNFLSKNKHGIISHASRIHKNSNKNSNQEKKKGSSSALGHMHSSVLTRKQTVASHPPLTVEPAVVEYYTCEKCSFSCFLSDHIQVQSHKKSCRTQLFDLFKLPKVSSGGEGKNQDLILSSHDSVATSTCKEESSIIFNSPEVVPDIDADKLKSGLLADNGDGKSQDTDILDKYDTDNDLDLCLDLEYFI